MLKKYKAISRVVNGKEVIGFIVKPDKLKKSSLFMSLDVISFGLSQKSFELENVKLSNLGKPRGFNGFLLSKLPITDLEDLSTINSNLLCVLTHILKDFNNTALVDSVDVVYSSELRGVLATYSVLLKNTEYSTMSLNIANTELKKTLSFYVKNLPKEYNKFYDDVQCEVTDLGFVLLTVRKTLVKGV